MLRCTKYYSKFAEDVLNGNHTERPEAGVG
jgi:hypothetical protein